MASDIQNVNILTRREIEALMAAPIIRAFAEKLGTEETLAILRPVIEELAHQSGQAAAELVGGNSVADFVTALEAWSAGDAYQFDVVKQTDDAYQWNVTHCAYADMYARLGMADLGYELSCARDFAMVKGFNPKMRLERTMTRMEGDPVCDFRLSLQKD